MYLLILLLNLCKLGMLKINNVNARKRDYGGRVIIPLKYLKNL